jgi:hypothetical protein|tara:strand:+ start:3650 stop:4564 length:915 start_codon:yes stop_codon:yes gene_type:complete
MSTGNFGTIRGADVSPSDVEIFVHYTPSRANTTAVVLTKLDPNQVLVKVDNPNNTNGSEIFGGMYTLNLPTSSFGKKGFYSVYIKPAEIRTKIIDCGVLASDASIKGLVFDTASLPADFVSRFENNGLVGYRIEYLNTDPTAAEQKVQNFFRIVTSNNKVEPVNQNLTNTNQKAIRYRLNDATTLTFCTVTPSSTSNVKPNALPFIGTPNQEVIITNTFFNPTMLEIEMVEHDIETLAVGLFGNQSKSLEDGKYTVYNFQDEIYHQADLFEIQDQFTGKPLFEVRKTSTAIDFTKQFATITSGI